ncbi:unnamed protein product [Owenia fusiformis]|uniref:Uncharacterized protein n=1 Tax=Owenia fusiformis TaxID=6347 RepID=A0A8J1ULX8_OWEFU|nr:unnamed protein product [Owenia fusiformis]
MSNKLAFIVFTTVVLYHVEALLYKDCGSAEGKILKVSADVCPGNTPPCMLPRGQNATITMDFSTSVDVKRITAVVHGVIAGIPVPFPLSNPDGCKDSGLVCPVKSGAQDVYKSTIAIKSIYPQIKLVIKWELKDTDTGKTITCFVMPAQLK